MEDTRQEDLRQLAKFFKALSDPTRLQILKYLQSGEDCANVIQKALGLSQPGLSYHMKVLSDAGLVRCRNAGQRTYYSIDTEAADRITELVTIVMKA